MKEPSASSKLCSFNNSLHTAAAILATHAGNGRQPVQDFVSRHIGMPTAC